MTNSGEILGKLDIDIWFNPTYENYYRLLNAIDDLNIDVSSHKQKVAIPKESYFRYEFENYKIDFLPEIKGLLKFYNCWNKRKIATINNEYLYFIAPEDLLASKEVNPRKKDIEDIKYLRNMLKNKSK